MATKLVYAPEKIELPKYEAVENKCLGVHSVHNNVPERYTYGATSLNTMEFGRECVSDAHEMLKEP